MDWNRVEGNWKQFKGNIKEKWGKLTDDDLDVIDGRRDQLEGKLQERYGYTATDFNNRPVGHPINARYPWRLASYLGNHFGVIYANENRALLEEAGVAITPGADFGANAAARHVRFAYTREVPVLAEGVRRIREYLGR